MRRGKLKTLVAVARTILVIIWHLLADPPAASTLTARHATTSASNHVRQLEALEYAVTITAAA